MNNSGEGVSYLLSRFAADLEHFLVIYDEMALPFGRLRIRCSGSDGGHKGVESIISTLRTQTFPRLRLGIGHPPQGRDPVEFVLSRFSKEESMVVDRVTDTVVQAVECWLEEGIDAAMNRFN